MLFNHSYTESPLKLVSRSPNLICCTNSPLFELSKLSPTSYLTQPVSNRDVNSTSHNIGFRIGKTRFIRFRPFSVNTKLNGLINHNKIFPKIEEVETINLPKSQHSISQ